MGAHSPKRLLAQARHLALRERKKPQQDSPRRAVSTAYYALFHCLVGDASRSLAPSHLAAIVARAFDHGEMKEACKPFASSNLPALLTAASQPGGVPVPPALRDVAQAFIDLQEARHRADYTDQTWARSEALDDVTKAETAVATWNGLRPKHGQPTQPAVHLFLVWLLFQKKLAKRQ